MTGKHLKRHSSRLAPLLLLDGTAGCEVRTLLSPIKEDILTEKSLNSATAFAKAPCHGNRLSATMMAPAAVCPMAGATAFLTPLVASAQERSYEWGWGMHPMWWAWGAGGVVMMVMMLAFWGVVIVSLVLGIRWLIHQRPASRSDSALEIVRQRYGRGEINREEFEAKKRDLT